MKKFSSLFLTLATLLALLLSFLPLSTALAKKDPANVDLKVNNRTGGQVLLTLLNTDGQNLFFTLEPGKISLTLPMGKYQYYASTPCGNRAGVFNLNDTKDLSLACGQGAEVTLQNPAKVYCYSVWSYPYTDDEWLDYGPHCQDNPAEFGDPIQNEYLPGYWEVLFFVDSGKDYCAPDQGPAYYYIWNCE